MYSPRIAIVGAGFSAVSLLQQLWERQPQLAEIHLFGVAEEFGTGLAYAPYAGASLLNTRAADLGVSTAAVGGFADWADLKDIARDRFRTRAEYGSYLQDTLNDLLASSELPITVHRRRVSQVRRSAEGFEVQAGAVTVVVDALVLATGPLAQAPLAMLDATVRAAPAYVDDPWRKRWTENLDPDARIVMIGSGLSMLDHALRLRAQAHRQPVLAISRHGWLPRPHPPRRLPTESLSEPFHRARHSGSVRAMLRRMREACTGREDWPAAFDAIRPHIPEIWRSLDVAERARFLRHLRSAWEIHRHRMASHLWDEAQSWLAEGWLRILPALIVDSSLVDGGIELTLRHRGSAEVEHVRADHLLRATGIDGPLAVGRDPLIDSLLQQGLVTGNAFDLGIAVDENARVLDAVGAAVPGLYALGTLARGCLWESTAIPELRRAAAGIAEALSVKG